MIVKSKKNDVFLREIVEHIKRFFISRIRNMKSSDYNAISPFINE